ncbi:MAG: hypothetical protein EXS03_07170 [Phycisphaerales bacterium]|nr:hypothetical protein [Phycisphaerales bacterium]
MKLTALVPDTLAGLTVVAALAAGAALDASQAGGVAKGSPYPLATCPVSGKPLGESPTILVMEDKENPLLDGREIRFCCGKCPEQFKADPSKFLPAVDEAIITLQRPGYPLMNCAVMTEDALAKPGEPDADKIKEIVVHNELVRLCCKGCVKKVKNDPAKILAAIDAAAIAAQSKAYPLVTCPISGEALDDDAARIVISERLVKLCCMGCAEKARKDPLKVLAKLDAATAAKAAPAPAAPSATK